MTSLQQPLYSLDSQAFDAAVNSLLSRALPGLDVGFRDEPPSDTLVPLKTLTESLVRSGPSGSCGRCNLSVLQGCMVDICLACGERSYAAGIVSDMPWNGSHIHQRFLQSIPYKPPKNKRRSSRASGGSAVEVSMAPREISTSRPYEGSPEFSSQASTGSGGRGSAVFGNSKSGDSPWSSTLDTGNSDPMNEFSLTEASFDMGFFASTVGGDSRGSDMLDDLFAQLGGTPAAGKQKVVPQESSASSGSVDPGVQGVLKGLPDLSFLLADQLVVPQKNPGKFPPEVPQMMNSTAHVPAASPVVDFTVASASTDSQDEWGDFA